MGIEQTVDMHSILLQNKNREPLSEREEVLTSVIFVMNDFFPRNEHKGFA